MQDWTSDDEYKSDSSAFVFRLDTKATYSPKLQSRGAIYCYSSYGPSFGNDALTLRHDPMNEPGKGQCYVDKDRDHESNYKKGFKPYNGHDTSYKIKENENGNSPLTGEGINDWFYNKHQRYFTCVELEVYQIWL